MKPLVEILDELQELGVRKVEAYFEGSGDSGDLEEITLRGKVTRNLQRKAKELAATLAWAVLDEIGEASFDGPGCAVHIEVDLETGEALWEVRWKEEVEEEAFLAAIPLKEALQGIPEDLQEKVLEATEYGLAKPNEDPRLTAALKTLWANITPHVGHFSTDDYLVRVYPEEGVLEVLARSYSYELGQDTTDGRLNVNVLAQEEFLGYLAGR